MTSATCSVTSLAVQAGSACQTTKPLLPGYRQFALTNTGPQHIQAYFEDLNHEIEDAEICK